MLGPQRIEMEISLSITFQGQTSQFGAKSESIMIGRSRGADAVDIDLRDDTRVSRRHARITWENDIVVKRLR
jgi:pSer/pThr/pTyr-binding forkhead associated (FHA) protein